MYMFIYVDVYMYVYVYTCNNYAAGWSFWTEVAG